eukprot:74966_1
MTSATLTKKDFIITERLIYDANGRKDDNYLISGYIRKISNNMTITKKILQLLINLYGRKYIVHGCPPIVTQFDYVVCLLEPMKMLGITFCPQHKKISEITSKFAHQNFIVGSQMIQINDQWIAEMQSDKFLQLFAYTKQHSPFYMILQCDRQLAVPGIHLEYNVRLIDTNCRFPYDAFTCVVLKNVFKCIFEHDTELYQVYANTNTGEISILLFIHSLDYDEDKLIIKDAMIAKAFKDEVSFRPSVFHTTRTTQLHGCRGNTLDSILVNQSPEQFYKDNKTMSSLLKLVKGVNKWRAAWYLFLVDVDKITQFEIAMKSDIIHLENIGHIIHSGTGDVVPHFHKHTCNVLFNFGIMLTPLKQKRIITTTATDVPKQIAHKKSMLQKKLRQTIFKNRFIVTDGCGNTRCTNPYCKSNERNTLVEYTDKQASKFALMMTKQKHKGCGAYKLREIDDSVFDIDIIKELKQWGFSKKECVKAMQMTIQYDNINEVLNTLQNMQSISFNVPDDNKTQLNSQSEVIDCKGIISACSFVTRLFEIILSHKNKNSVSNVNANVLMLLIINDYLHLLETHNTDCDIEEIYNN